MDGAALAPKLNLCNAMSKIVCKHGAFETHKDMFADQVDARRALIKMLISTLFSFLFLTVTVFAEPPLVFFPRSFQMSESTQKLTKRQQKALAHRSGASRQDKKKAKRDQLESLSGLPQEDLDENDGQDGDAAATAEESAPKASTAKAKGKKKADAAGQGEGDAAAAAQDGDSEGPAKPKKNHRFICFCGMSITGA